MFFVKIFLSVLAVTLSFSAFAEDEGIDVASKVSSQIVCVQARDNEKNQVIGSGFFVAPNLIVSSAHQIKNAKNIFVFLKNGKKLEVEKAIIKENKDIAFLKTKQNHDSFLPLLKSEEKVLLGQSVFTIGCPYGLEYSLSRGVISHEARRINNKNLIQTDVPVGFGSSGGPLITKKGRVAGIFHGVLKESGAISFVVPAKDIEKTLKSIGVNTKLLSDKELYSLWQKAKYEIDPRKKVKLYKKIIEKQPDLVDAYVNMGVTYSKADANKKAIKSFLKALSLEKNYFPALLNLGLVYYHEKNYQAAKNILKKAYEQDKISPAVHYNLGLVYKNLGEKELMKKHFLEFLRLDKNAKEAKLINRWISQEE